MRKQMRAAVWVSLAMVALSVADAPAQTRQVPPAAPPAEAPPPAPQTEPEQPAEGRYRFSPPIVGIGQDYTLRAGDVVREIRNVFGDVTIEGRVEGDVVVVLGAARLASTAVVEGSLVVVGGSGTIDAGASVRRDLVVVGGTLTAPPGFSNEGEHVVIGTAGVGHALRGLVPWITRGLLWGRLIVPDLRWMWVAVGTMFLVFLLLTAIFERPVRACADTLVERPLSSFLLGLLVLVLTVPVLAILVASVVGIAVVPFALCALLAAGLVGKAGVALAIGRSVVHESADGSRVQSFRSLVIGLIVLVLAYMVPVLGVVTWAITGVLGLGAAAVAFRVALRREHPARVRPAAPVVVAAPQPVAAAEAAGVATAEPAGVGGGVPLEFAAPAAPPSLPPPGGDLSLYPRATFLDRLAAFALDCILVGIAIQVLDLSRHDGAFPSLLLAYHIAFWAWKGTTLGGIICGLRVIRMQGTDLRFADALVRGLSSVFSIAALGIGCFWMLQDPERQMWHDKIAGTLVVKVPRHMALP